MKHKFLIAIFCIGLLGLYFACEKDDTFIKEESVVDTSATQITPTLNTLSYDNAGDTFNRLKSELQIGPYFQFEQNDDVLSRSAQDTLGFTIYTDVIKEVIADNYLSYTMLIVTPSTTDSKFYNLTIEDKNGEADMFISKYVPSAEWLQDKSKAFKGNISVYRVDTFEAVPIDDGGGTNDDDYPSTDPEGSPYYPTDCNGYVIVTIEQIPYPCTCPGEHMPWEYCPCESDGGNPPGYDEVPYYLCVEATDWSNPNDTGNSNGNTNTGGGTTNTSNSNSDPSMGGFVPNDDEPCEPPYNEWDTDQNCRLDELEICNRDYGNGSTICSCIENGGNLDGCIFESELEHLGSDMDKECQQNKILKVLNIESEITNRITNAFFGNDEANLLFADVDIPEDLDAIAFTFPPENMVLNESTGIAVGFDNSYLDNATDLSMVVTTSHELIHVYFYYLFIEGNLLDAYPDYTNLNTAFENYQNDINSSNLEALGESMHAVYNDFLDLMIEVVYNYVLDNNIPDISQEYCTKLVIGNHQNTETFQDLTEEEQTEYSTIANNEENGTPDAKGTKCEE